ncbi:MAG: DNA-protecting protein DprA [Nitrospirae bacterium]|nr:DNA-protecting protein DprA [Nitrospirota bacterium]
MEILNYWIALSLIDDIGPRSIRALLDSFGDAKCVFQADIRELLQVEGIGEKRARAIKGFNRWKEVERILSLCETQEIKILTENDESYPVLLKNIHTRPFLLYLKGKILEEDRYAVAVVGPRKPTEYGVRVADMIAGELAKAGITVVSGMARGIDTVAHKAAIIRGGRTIAVLGSGIDVPYPPENAGLMKRITKSGYVVSEFPPGTKPERGNFPVRNRIISGLSLGVVVIEATNDSGALITAEYALEQNREVFSVPGMITSKRSSGTNTLIKKGAVLVESAEDIIKELAPQLKGFIREASRRSVSLSDDESNVVKYLSKEPVHVDVLTRESKIPLNKLLSILTALELKGVVKQAEGKRFYLS